MRRQRRRYMATRTDDAGGAGLQRAAAHSMGSIGGIMGHGKGSAAERAKKARPRQSPDREIADTRFSSSSTFENQQSR